MRSEIEFKRQSDDSEFRAVRYNRCNMCKKYCGGDINHNKISAVWIGCLHVHVPRSIPAGENSFKNLALALA